MLLQIRGLIKHFEAPRSIFNLHPGTVRAVDGVDLFIRQGETLGLVGESGCGKSTLGRTILSLIPATGGEVRYRGEDILRLPGEKLRLLKQKMQIVFQDPYSSLNPRMTVLDLVSSPLDNYRIGSPEERQAKVVGMLNRVGLGEEHLYRYPHEFSGGQRQRIGIARALVLNPEFVVCDEPVSALDVSVRSQVLNLMDSLQKEFGLTYLFISHDLSVVRHISDRVAVMYLGKIVEIAGKKDLYQDPRHPYTKALLSAIPIPDPSVTRKRTPLSGDVPSAYNPPGGCRFHPRCPRRAAKCEREEPRLEAVSGDHQAACHFLQEDHNDR
ncbi:MAG: ATP-binding cassette domain-containing protein [Treponema sp.]|jgi:peptide/nickel transport system ATP-binding protein/oligopeptide transport system ATP-binding protein|nr:ATP-binding cassette domain-containing protein [Treponema sp.]